MNDSSPALRLNSYLDRKFRLREHGTNVRTEVVGGTTNFMAMAYILAVNPAILLAAGMDPTAVLLATALSSAIATFAMAYFGKMPFALSSGMGLNAFLAYTVVLGHGYSWQLALFCVFLEGLVFIFLTMTNVREMLFDAIPHSLKLAIAAGIGLFIAFIGLQNSGIVIANESTLVGMINFRENFHTAGISAILTIVGMFLIFMLEARKIKGSMLIGIIATWVLGMFCQLVGLYVPDPAAGFYSVYPALTLTDWGALGLTFGQCFNFGAFSGAGLLDVLIVTLTFLYSDVVDTTGTLIGGAEKGNMLDKDGKLPNIKGAFLADAIGTTVGAIFGTSTVTTFVESSAGIVAGARTGLASIVTGILFLLSTFAASLFTSIPSFATAPALLVVGFMMFTSAGKLKLADDNSIIEMIPAFLCMLGMIVFYSIAEGIVIGVIAYVVLHLVTGKAKKVSPFMYVLAVIFLLKYLVI